MPVTYAIGDVVWIDANRDGVQDARERPLAGVTVTLLDASGAPIEGVDPVVTDEDGRCLFDELPAGEYRVSFTLTPAQSVQYAFTTADAATGGAGADSDAVVSDSDLAVGVTGVISLNDENESLTTSYDDQAVTATRGIDPTWDAGVIIKHVSVGDHVFIDMDGDGVQGPGDKPLAGVVLSLIGFDGTPVLDEFGAPRTTTTDSAGRYSFDDLPALPKGEYYTVTLDPNDPANVKALDGLMPTRDGAGGDSASDSSTWTVNSGDLMNDGDRDSSLDFGFVLKPVPPVTEQPGAGEPSGDQPLAVTGGATPFGIIAFGLGLLLLGVLALLARARFGSRIHMP